jgi:hypothetical protein
VVDEPIDHRSGDTSSPNTSPQRPKGFVGGDDQAGAFIAGRDELEEVHVGCFRYLSQYSQLTATVWLDFALFAIGRFATCSHRLQPRGSIEGSILGCRCCQQTPQSRPAGGRAVRRYFGFRLFFGRWELRECRRGTARIDGR